MSNASVHIPSSRAEERKEREEGIVCGNGIIVTWPWSNACCFYGVRVSIPRSGDSWRSVMPTRQT